MRANVESISISIEDAWKLLEAEEALLSFIPDGGIPKAQALWDFFGRIHRIVLQTQDRGLEFPNDNNPLRIEVVSRRTQILEGKDDTNEC